MNPRIVSDLEMDRVKIVHLDSYRLCRSLFPTAGPADSKLNDYLWAQGVDVDHVIKLLDGQLARYERSVAGRSEDCVFLPIVDEDGVTPLDVLVFPMCQPSAYWIELGRGAVLGAAEILNPATYWDGEPCRLLRTPLEWLQNGIEGCAVILDPPRAKQIFDWAPGDFAAINLDHAQELVRMGVDPKRIVVPVRRAA
jgi:hypothetical protein